MSYKELPTYLNPDNFKDSDFQFNNQKSPPRHSVGFSGLSSYARFVLHAINNGAEWSKR